MRSSSLPLLASGEAYFRYSPDNNVASMTFGGLDDILGQAMLLI